MRYSRRSNLIKLLGVVAVVIIAAAAFALPAYNDRARRSELQEAFQNLSDIQVWMENFHNYGKTFARVDTCGAAVVPPERAQYFSYACALDTTAGAPPGQSYTATAKGKSRHTAGFSFRIDQTKARATAAIPADWGPLPADARSAWVDRKP